MTSRLDWRHTVVLCLAVGAIGGCSIFKSKTNRENIEPPAELVDIANELNIDRVWSSSIGDGEQKLGLRQSVQVENGRVYSASSDGRIMAIDAASGKTVWKLDSEERWSGGPGVGEGTLVLGSLDGTVVALNPDNGNERWRANVSSEVIAAPAIGRGLVVVRVNDGRVFAYSVTDGERRWVYDRGLPSLTLRGNGSPRIFGDSVYVGYDSGFVVALKHSDGTQLWEQTIAEAEGRSELDRMVDVDGELVVDGSEVYAAAYNGQVVALDAGSGRPLWSRDMSVFTGLSLSGDRLLVSDNNATVWALDRRTGASVWRQDGLAHRWLTTPVVDGQRVVVGDLQGYLHWLDLASGELVGRERIANDPIRATPKAFDGVLLAQTIEGKVAAYRAAP